MEKRKKTAIIGAGRGGFAFLLMLSDYKELEIMGISEINPDAPGIKLARQLGIPVFENYLDFLKMKDLELIINLTGNPSIDNVINESLAKTRERKKDLEILGGTSAKLVWEIVNNAKRKEEEKAKLAKYLSDLNQELYDIKEYLENVVENSADAIITTDLDRKIVSFNQGAENLLGYNRKEVIEKNVNFLWKNKEERDKLLDQLEKHGSVSNYETALIKKNNQAIQVILTLSHLKNKAGEIIGTVGISKDVSEKKKMEKELLRRNEELDSFVYTISHDLQAPLRAIDGFSNLLMEENKECLDESATHYIERIKKGAERMKLLIDDLLDYSRIGRQKNMFEKVDILEILTVIKEFFHFDLKEKKGEMTFDAKFPAIFCDKTRVQQVFSNLISNAIKFCDQNPVIEIGYTARNDTHEFYIKDNGMGIEEDFHQKIFHIFQRLHNAEEYEGTGIGLTIVQKIVELHNGKIWLESLPGKGTTFYFTIAKSLVIGH